MEMGVQRGPGGDPRDPSLTPEDFLGTSLDELGREGGGGIEGGRRRGGKPASRA